MRMYFKLALLSAAAVALSVTVCVAWAEEPAYQPPAPMQQWLTDSQKQGTIQPGTAINKSNWQRYEQFLPYGLQTILSG
jgi:Spy/CpxP family protein refolding chaperone